MTGPQFSGLQHANDMSGRNLPIAVHPTYASIRTPRVPHTAHIGFTSDSSEANGRSGIPHYTILKPKIVLAFAFRRSLSSFSGRWSFIRETKRNARYNYTRGVTRLAAQRRNAKNPNNVYDARTVARNVNNSTFTPTDTRKMFAFQTDVFHARY